MHHAAHFQMFATLRLVALAVERHSEIGIYAILKKFNYQTNAVLQLRTKLKGIAAPLQVTGRGAMLGCCELKRRLVWRSSTVTTAKKRRSFSQFPRHSQFVKSADLLFTTGWITAGFTGSNYQASAELFAASL